VSPDEARAALSAAYKAKNPNWDDPFSSVSAVIQDKSGNFYLIGTGAGYVAHRSVSSSDVIVAKFLPNGTVDQGWGNKASLFYSNAPGTSFYNHGVGPDNSGSFNHRTNTVEYAGDTEEVLGVILGQDNNLYILDRWSANQNKLAVLSIGLNGSENGRFGKSGWLK